MTSASTCTGECLKSGPWGLAIVLLLCVACYFLFRSMSRHLKKVREEFPSDKPGVAAPKTVVGDGNLVPNDSPGAAPVPLTKPVPDDESQPPA